MIIFVTGNSRSGTTMMGRILNRHPDVFTFNELHFFGNLWEPGTGKEILTRKEAIDVFSILLARQREGFLIYRHPYKYNGEAEKALAEIADNCLNPSLVYRHFLLYETARHGKKIPCEQTPSNGYYAKFILNELEDSFFVNMIRDPRDVMVSQKKKWKRKFLGASKIPLKESIRSWFNYHPVLMALLWKKNMIESMKLRNHKRCMMIYFEKLVAYPETVLNELCHFLQLNFHPEMMQVPHAGSSSRSDQFSSAGIDSSVAGQWKKRGLTRTETWWCEKIAGKQMLQQGYVLSGYQPNPVLFLWLVLLLPVKTGLSFLMNLSRMKNIRKTIAHKFGNA